MSARDDRMAPRLGFLPPRSIRYTLTAELGTQSDSDFYAFDWVHECSGGGARRLTQYPGTFPATIDGAAMMGATGVILSNASESRMWARGRITLRDPFGRVVDVMPAKGSRRYRVSGHDRAAGALGVFDDWTLEVDAEDAEHASELAKAERYAAGRDHVLTKLTERLDA